MVISDSLKQCDIYHKPLEQALNIYQGLWLLSWTSSYLFPIYLQSFHVNWAPVFWICDS